MALKIYTLLLSINYGYIHFYIVKFTEAFEKIYHTILRLIH